MPYYTKYGDLIRNPEAYATFLFEFNSNHMHSN